MKWAATAIEQYSNAQIEKVQQGNYLMNEGLVAQGEEPIVIGPEDIEIMTDEIPGYEIASKGSLTVALDITITQVLQNEGNARELVNRIQQIRKEKDFELTDHIVVKVGVNSDLQASFIEFKDYICREILADSIEFGATISDGISIEINDIPLIVEVYKKNN